MDKDPLKDEVRLLLEKTIREKEEGELLLREKYPEMDNPLRVDVTRLFINFLKFNTLYQEADHHC